MALRIGFATEFYTLWDIDIQPQYTKDANGNAWHTHDKWCFWYQQNISKDIEKVKALYPGVPIDEELRGITRSWDKVVTLSDPCPHILKFGKYRGQDLSWIAEKDFNYLLWLVNNCYDSKVRELVLALPQVIAYLAEKDAREQAELNAIERIQQSGIVELRFIKSSATARSYSTTEDNQFVLDYCVRATLTNADQEKTIVFVSFDDAKYMEGSYSYPGYYMPVVDGKGKRLSGKTVKVEVELLHTITSLTDYQGGRVTQYVKFKKFVK